MMFFFKKKKIVLDCFTDRQYVMDYAQIDHAYKFLPQWWKALPKAVQQRDSPAPDPTMKTCFGFTNLYQQGAIIPMWTEAIVGIGEIGSKFCKIEFADTQTGVYVHGAIQRGTYLPEEHYSHVKIMSPWHVQCTEEINWMFTFPSWSHPYPEEFIVPPGCVDFKYQMSTNINMFVKHGTQRRLVTIEPGTPMIHLIPLSDRELDIKCHLIGKEELERIDSRHTRVSFVNKYSKIKKLIKKQDKGICPFKF